MLPYRLRFWNYLTLLQDHRKLTNTVVHASLPFTVLKLCFSCASLYPLSIIWRSCMLPYRLRFWNISASMAHQDLSLIWVVHASLPFTVLKLNNRDIHDVGVLDNSRACFPTVYGFETYYNIYLLSSLLLSSGRACFPTVYGFETFANNWASEVCICQKSCMLPYRLRFWNREPQLSTELRPWYACRACFPTVYGFETSYLSLEWELQFLYP